MSEVEEFVRHCPVCGRRFHIKLVSKNLVDERQEVVPLRQGIMNLSPRAVPVVLQQDIPITIDVEDFRYSYKCKHCGHEWSETRVKQTKR
jgi:DNA-directed RNA polymerase subunit RPC12/RpoP